MKIAFIHHSMGIHNRGSEISTHLIANELAKHHQVLIIQSGPAKQGGYRTQVVMPQKTLPSAAPQKYFEKILFRLYLDPLSRNIKKFTHQAIGILKDFNPDVIIPVNGKPQIQIIKVQFPDKKIIVFGRAGIGYHDRDTLKTTPDIFIALSPTAAKWAQSIASKKTKVVYLPNPINKTAFQTAKPTLINLKKPIVLTVAAFSRYKNLDTVIRAVAATHASLLLIGQGEEKDTLTALAKQLLAGRFQIMSVEPADLPGIYRAADVFCLVPDGQEAFGRVYLEAMASGLPIIASDDPIRHQIIGSKGIFVPPNVSHITAAINTAVGQGRIDYNHQLAEFNLDAVVSRLEELLIYK